MKKKIILSVLIGCMTVVVRAAGYNGYNGCAEQDSLALVAFYWATDGPNWTSNQDGFSINDLSDEVLTYHSTDYPHAGMGKWLEGPVKDWFGVLLEKQPIGNSTDSVWRVVHLRATVSRRSAGDNNLKGYVPKEVGLLTALKWFKVNGNTGLSNTELPDEIYHPTLLELDVEATYFSGIVSDAFKKCNKLEFINLRYNYFDSLPVLDFFTHAHLLDKFGTNGKSVFFYNNQLSYATIEPTVELFMSVSADIKYQARQLNNVGRAREIVVAPGQKITLSSNDAGKNGEYNWYKKGMNTYVTGNEYTINSVSASDTGNYTALLKNEYIRLNDENIDYINSFTKPIRVTFTPSAPLCTKLETSYQGKHIALKFSKPMSGPLPAQASEFNVMRNGSSMQVKGIVRTGRLRDILVLEMDKPIEKDDTLTLSYAPGTIVDENGGVLKAFDGRAVKNMVRAKPNLLKAITRTDGEGIILYFDRFIDPKSLVTGDFHVHGTEGNSVAQITLRKGPLDPQISKEVELVMSDPLFDTDNITVTYKSGSLTGLYGAFCEPFSDLQVENTIVAKRTNVTLSVVDGTKKIKGILVKGDMKSLPFKLYDDGTHGDNIAGDHVWGITLPLTHGTYNWEVYNHIETGTRYDTIGSGDTLILVKKVIYQDSLISSGTPLNVKVGDVVTGDTVFEYNNNALTFILNMKKFLQTNPGTEANPYLMGIGDDWTEGLALAALDPSNIDSVYLVKVSGFRSGESVTFNFRNGTKWENSTPASRGHIVLGNDTIWAVFGHMPLGMEKESRNASLFIFPNPASTVLNIQLPEHAMVDKVTICNLLGQHILSFDGIHEGLDISHLAKGFYIIHVRDRSANVYKKQFLKK
jgi:uncharacterized repeat protein (TIGR02059 family)